MAEKQTPKQLTEEQKFEAEIEAKNRLVERQSKAQMALEILRLHHAHNAKPVNADMLRIAQDVLRQYLG